MVEKYTLQCLIFDKNKFQSPLYVKNWVLKKGYKLMPVRNPIKSFDDFYRVRQKEPNKFKPFNKYHKIKYLGKNKVKAIYGILK